MSTYPLASSRLPSSTSATTTDLPSTDTQTRTPAARRMITVESDRALDMGGTVRPLAKTVYAQTGAQCSAIPQQKRCCTTLAHTEAVAALRSLGAVVTIGRAVRQLGWTLYEARFWLEKLSGQRVLVATRRGHVWAERARP